MSKISSLNKSRKCYLLQNGCFFSELDKDAKECQLFRLSFSSAERDIITHLDEQNEVTHRAETCRKDVLRLLKYDLQKDEQHEHISSYVLKTLLLHLVEYYNDSSDWQRKQLWEKYMLALLVLERCLKEKYLQHFFIPGENLFKHDLPAGPVKRELSNVIKSILQK